MLSWIGDTQSALQRSVLLDRDGVLNHDHPDYITSWEEYQFYPDALDALRWLKHHGIGTILISNQSALHRGLVDWDGFWQLHQRVINHVRAAGGDIRAAFYCPHRPEENCWCRKPSPRMILAAARIFGLHLPSTPMIGDRLTDLISAARAGCRAVWLQRENAPGPQQQAGSHHQIVPDLVCTTLHQAVQALFAAPWP
jgi:D-glycero-D-manno-heptose 1,7-bisphosphate phosphatase